MHNYILVCDKNTILPSLKESRWGVKEKDNSRLDVINTNDSVFFYIKAKSALSNKGCICGPFQVNKSAIEPDIGYYFEQGYSKIIEFLDKQDKLYAIFKEIVDKLEIVNNKQHWGMTFMGRALIQINPSDAEIISLHIKNNGYEIRL